MKLAPLRLRDASAQPVGRWVTPEELNVAPGLLGQPLARPSRRLWAIAVDLLAIALMSWLANLWILAALALPLAERARTRRTGPSRSRRWLAWGLALPLAFMGLQEAASEAHRPGADDKTVVDGADDDADESDGAASAQAAASAVVAAIAAAKAASASLPATAATAASAALTAAAAAEAASATTAQPATVDSLQARVAVLEKRLAAAHAAAAEAAKPPSWRERLGRWADELGLGYGWSIVYFSLLPAWWNGQTLGKRFFGLRVREITGKPMTAMRNLKRYGGYIAGMATGGLGLAQVLWDPNRQAIQDKTAHTVVIDERLPRRELPMPFAEQSAEPPPLAASPGGPDDAM